MVKTKVMLLEMRLFQAFAYPDVITENDYLKKDILGISFDAGPFSVPFEFNIPRPWLKTH